MDAVLNSTTSIGDAIQGGIDNFTYAIVSLVVINGLHFILEVSKIFAKSRCVSACCTCTADTSSMPSAKSATSRKYDLDRIQSE